MRIVNKIKNRRGFTTIEMIIVALIISVVAVSVTSTIGGAMGKLAGRDKRVIMCQDPAYAANHTAECANP